MSLLSQIRRLLFHPTSQIPVDRFHLGTWEMLLMRVAFSFLIFSAIKWEVGTLQDAVNDPEKLTGLSHFLNLNWVQEINPLWLWRWVTIAGLAIYSIGILPLVGLMPALFFSITIGTLANSQGAINHSTQLVSMILLGQFLVYLIPVGNRIKGSKWWKPVSFIHQRAIYVSLVVFAAAYMVSGWVKLDRSEGEWISRVPNLALELQKSNYSEYYDTLKPVPETLTMVVRLMDEHPNLARLFFGGGLMVEMLAFLILLGRRWACVYGILIIVMHLSISHLMQLDFWYHMIAALIFAVNLPGIWKTFGGGEKRQKNQADLNHLPDSI